MKVKGLFRPHSMAWSEQQRLEFHAPEYLRNIIRIISETGLRVYKELMPMKKEQVDLQNAVVWIPDSNRRTGNLVVSERRESDGASEDAEDSLARSFTKGQGTILPDLRSAVYLRDSLKRGWRSG